LQKANCMILVILNMVFHTKLKAQIVMAVAIRAFTHRLWIMYVF